jgi:hypothetical protein
MYRLSFNYIDFEGAEEDTAAFEEIVEELVAPADFRAITANL